jgi:hypothetical protein
MEGKMTELQCRVENCTFNKETCCCKGDITVGGRDADRDNDTCCASFAQRREGHDAFTNSTATPQKDIRVSCEAGKCVYNNDYRCNADHVDIKGGGASNAKGTACATFRES